MSQVHFTQRDVRNAAPILGAFRKANRLGRGRSVTLDLYAKWNATVRKFHHQHSFAEEVEGWLVSHPEIEKGIDIPK